MAGRDVFIVPETMEKMARMGKEKIRQPAGWLFTTNEEMLVRINIFSDKGSEAATGHHYFCEFH